MSISSVTFCVINSILLSHNLTNLCGCVVLTILKTILLSIASVFVPCELPKSLSQIMKANSS